MDPVEIIVRIDRALLDAVTALRAGPVTPVMRLASEWWVKSLAIPAIGVAAELARRPRALPPTIPLAAAALALASLSSSSLKDLFDRARPTLADPSLTALIGLPGDSSFPSGHATSAFAAAGIVAALHPSLRAPALALASLVAVSRVYLGVHHPVDITAGALLGLLIAVVVIVTSQRAIPAGRWRTTLSTPALTARMRRWPRPLTA
ncbi:phosphatase PAP2 family protein [Miltoncostaea oceani]|uniref:phosphatase PAP2 family protein n=1 Tax=Miltoncostaea oceani TaxID=2843216 RepID=UPI001C3E0DD7|nr:phosphatase PAP2 family protein [Miltoncostaea oceani]